MYKIGIDLGGTKIEGILLDEKYNTIYRKRIETHQENGYDSIVKSITSLINELKVKQMRMYLLEYVHQVLLILIQD
uniref:Fructokinase n=1 Tax=uncultured marine thaumarchaeote AD1000_20_B03 TaxID=1455899 RepID=A0A075FKU6_9ARCH|nr:hypothetical protein [uncultured marine thaumarchaeote AD1000_20_B03]